MPDLRLRRLERMARAGDDHARARLLLERVRQGALAYGRLRLAAHLGDEAAGMALGPERSVPAQTLEALLRDLALFEEAPWVRAALAASEEALSSWQPSQPADAAAARRMLGEVGAWLTCPCEQHRRRVARIPAPGRAPFARDLARAVSREGERARWARRTIRDAARYVGEAPVRERVTETLLEWALDSE